MVLGAAMLQAGPALAQVTEQQQEQQQQQEDQAVPLSQSTNTDKTTPPSAPEKNAIIVTGQRRALRTSQQIKKNADTVVDSITATDIGAFPDKSVAEALQRVPGITVNRFAATSDTAHFSAEPSGVIIRGLPQVRSEFNGRDTFSANSSRGLSWTDITPELLAGVDVYKNQTADMIEGGIAGSVDLRTRVPFDAKGQLIQVGARANYGDLDKKWTPDVNGFYSNRWQTEGGEFGIMANVAYSHVKTRSQGIQYGRTAIVENGAPDWPELTFFPASINFLNNEYDRKRYGIAAAGQWKSNSGKVLATAQYLRSLYKNNWRERSFGDWGLRSTDPAISVGAFPYRLRGRPTSRSTRTAISRAASSAAMQATASSGGATRPAPPASAPMTRVIRCSRPATAGGRHRNARSMRRVTRAMRRKSAPEAASTRTAT
jgi:TonB-dependent receptor